MAFRRYGGIQFSSNNNYIRSVLNNPSYLNITQGSGAQETTEIFYSDLSLVGNLLVEGNTNVIGNISINGTLDVLSDCNIDGNETISGNLICNKNITLSTSFVTPTAGQLGYTYSNTIQQTTAASGTIYNLGSVTLDVGVYQLNGLFTITTPASTTSSTLTSYTSAFAATTGTLIPLGTGIVQGSNMSVNFVNGTTYRYSLSSIYKNTSPSTSIYLNGQIVYIGQGLRLIGAITATRIA